MIELLTSPLRRLSPTGRRHERLLLSARQLEREIARERIRATRRSVPFCILSIHLRFSTGSGRVKAAHRRTLISLLHHRLRVTDEKGVTGLNQFGVLLVDTPEMGGRAALDRLQHLATEAGLDLHITLQVHDPEGFGNDVEPPKVTPSGRRRNDLTDPRIARPITSLASEPVSVQYGQPGDVVQPWVTLKRCVDVTGAIAGLALASPIVATAAILIRRDGGPAFFRQTREGLHGRPFTIYKLRTMVIDAEATQAALASENLRDGPAFKIRRDPRVTRIGQFLRTSCLDELPQLINVLRGEMSLVGPRPLPWHESRACSRWHRRRLDVKPGMTCIWQVNKAKAVTFDDWMRMDLAYIDRVSLIGDLRLIAQTVAVPLMGRGAE